MRPDSANPGNGLPAITSDIIINGNGATIERLKRPFAPAFRILFVSGTGRLLLKKTTVSGGERRTVPAPPPPLPFLPEGWSAVPVS